MIEFRANGTEFVVGLLPDVVLQQSKLQLLSAQPVRSLHVVLP